MADRFLIAPYDKESGLRTNYRPWLIPDAAFSSLENAYIFRGRVRKRFGSRWLGNDQSNTRLRLSIGVTLFGDTFTYNVNTISVVPAVGQMFSIGPNQYTVASNALVLTNGLGVATYNFGTGVVTINGSGQPIGTTVYFYPALPVMGLLSYDSLSGNVEPTIAFDTRFSYQYDPALAGWKQLGSGAVAQWQGSDSQFFYATTWVGDDAAAKILFVTNFNVNETQAMRYLLNNVWYTYQPILEIVAGPTNIYLLSCRLFVVFHGYLIALNTWEGNTPGTATNYQNRARWTWRFSPLDATAWRDDIPGRGSGDDAATTDAIVGARFVQDRLMVYFEQSTWELVFTSNGVQPFVWQKINTELGAESPFSVIPFDSYVIGIGNTGIHSCNGVGVERIDVDIPTLIEDISNVNNGPDRVYGIRDFGTELLYWSYPDATLSSTNVYPNKVLVYNYRNNTYGLNDDSITCFGYFQSLSGVTWDSLVVKWDSNTSWDGESGSALYKDVIAGNQQGFTFIIDSNLPDNAPNLFISSLIISGLVTIISPNHGLIGGSFIYLNGITGTNNLSNLNGLIFQVITVVNKDTIKIDITNLGISGTYTGSGTMATVSNMTIATKEFNFYFKQGLNCTVEKIDFQVTSTTFGQVSIDVQTSTNLQNNMDDGVENGSVLGTGVLETSPYDLYPYEELAERLVHSFFPQAEGSFVQITIYLSNAQMMDPRVRSSQFELHSMTITASPTSRIQ